MNTQEVTRMFTTMVGEGAPTAQPQVGPPRAAALEPPADPAVRRAVQELRRALGAELEAFMEWLRSDRAAAWARRYAASQRLGDGGGTVEVLVRPGTVRVIAQRHGATTPTIDDQFDADEARAWADHFAGAGGWFAELADALRSAADQAEAGDRQ